MSEKLAVDAVVVGAGVAGLSAALGLAEAGLGVVVLTKGRLGRSGSSPWAQGGIAAAVGQDDSPESHAEDTRRVARGLGEEEVIAEITAAGPAEIERLLEAGAAFDRAPDGRLALGREGGHSRRRVLHSQDRTGAEIVRVLCEQVARHGRVEVLEEVFAGELLLSQRLSGARVAGVLAWRGDQPLWISATATILATGGLGHVYLYTTNPPEVTGDGIAMAARAGADLADLEMVQFHPTALKAPSLPGTQLPLLTEALRGEGAHLVDERGRRFLLPAHPDAELAPRDVIARILFRRWQLGQPSFLDLRPVIERWGSGFETRFPNAARIGERAGIDPHTQPLPITPAAHYAMGGVWTSGEGRTSLAGLWACGETAASGVHGANRLASNSLLEALVLGQTVARDAVPWCEREAAPAGAARTARPAAPPLPPLDSPRLLSRLRAVLWCHVGLERSAGSLAAALSALGSIDRERPSGSGEMPNQLLCGELIAGAALLRRESRGAHYRSDFPETRARYARRRRYSLEALRARVKRVLEAERRRRVSVAMAGA